MIDLKAIDFDDPSLFQYAKDMQAALELEEMQIPMLYEDIGM